MNKEQIMYFTEDWSPPQVKKRVTYPKGTAVIARKPSGPRTYTQGKVEVTIDRLRWHLAPEDKLAPIKDFITG